jgi:hypothetical protein
MRQIVTFSLFQHHQKYLINFSSEMSSLCIHQKIVY